MSRDPLDEHIHDDLAMTRPREADRALTMGAAIAVVLAVTALFGIIAVVFWLFL
jgi:hypothetical protein